MKNLKKVLAMVLAFACTFSMFAGAKVFEDVKAGSDYSEAITMLSDLGVIQGKDDGKYHPEDTITRAEACAMIARLMTGDPNVSQYVGAQSFVDVAKGSWKDSAIGYCYINGIVVGVGNNKFEPDRAITDAEFVTMVVRAMGYETADMKQNYPFSYMSNAQAIGLLDGVKMVANTDALRGEDAQVIYNALFTDYARGAKLVNTTHGTSVEQYPTLAESVWGLNRAGVGTYTGKDDETATLTNCKAHTWVVVGADKQKEGNILAYPIADDETEIYESGRNSSNGTKYVPYSFKYEGDVAAITGYEVELWGQGKHGQPTWEKGEGKFVFSDNWTIKAAKTVKGQTAYEYDSSKADSKSTNGTIELGESKLDLKSVAANAKNLAKANTTKTGLTTYLTKESFNGVETTSDKKVEEALNVRNGAQYKLMDWNSDGDIDWVVVSQANYYKVESVNSKRLTVSTMSAKNSDKKSEETSTDEVTATWKLDDLNDKSDYKVKYEAPEDLKEGDVIEVTYKTSYVKSEKCEVVTATIKKVEANSHELDKVSTKDTLQLTFDGDVMKIAQNKNEGDVIVPANPTTYGDFDDEELGTEFNLWTDRNGFIVYADYAKESSNYMMILDTKDGSDKTGDRSLAVADILLADNSVKKDVKFASDLKIDSKNDKSTGYNKSDRTWDEKLVVGNVYKYWTDGDGVVTKMESMISVKEAKHDKNYSYNKSSDRLKDSSDNYVASLEGAKVVFAVTQGYISGSGSDLKVDSDNVMAVKKSDIPDIRNGNNTTDTAYLTQNADSWLKDVKDTNGTDGARFIANVDKNGEASAAILGVENFNKFNDASTKVGLVTSVSYDKNKVVSIDVAYNGKVETLSSAEKKDFDDIVEAYNKSSKKDESLSSPTSTVNNTLFGGAKLSDYLKKNGAYAEITTDGDGKLTAVTFMDQDSTNKVVGHYYEVSRRIITSVKNGNVAFGNQDAYFYNNKNLYSVGRLNVSDLDLAKDVQYYSISGRPTRHDDKYDNQMLAVTNGFDGTPSIKAESDSVLINSYINDKFDTADTYQVADLARKIGGDIVAAFAFDGTLGEVDKAVSNLGDQTMKAGESKTLTVTAPAGQTVTAVKDVKVNGGSVNGITANAQSTNEIKIDLTRDVAAGKYTVSYTYTIDGKDYNGSFVLTVQAADALKVNTVKPMADATTEAVGGSVQDASGATFFTLADGNNAVSNVTGITFKDAQGFDVSGVSVAAGNNGVYKATGLTAGKTYSILVDGKEVGKLDVIANGGASVKLAGAASKSITDATMLDTVNEEYSVDLAGVPANTKIVVAENTIDQHTSTTSATKDGITVEVKDGKVTVKGTPTTNTTKDTFKVGYWDGAKAVEASVEVTPKKLTATEITATFALDNTATGDKNKKLSITLSYKGQQLTTEQVALLTLNSTAGSHTITGGGSASTVDAINSSANPIVLTLNAAADAQITAVTLNVNGNAMVDNLQYSGLTIDQNP